MPSISSHFTHGLGIGVAMGLALAMGPVGFVTGMSLAGAGTTAVAQVPSVPSVPSDIPDQPAAPAAAPVAAVDPKADHIRGNPNAKISIIEYSDYECPFCKRHHPTMQQLLAQYGEEVNWVYRHFPLSFHPFAEPAALASECVADIGGNDKFWEFTDKVFEIDSPDEADLPTIVQELGIDQKKYDECFTSKKYLQKVQDQLAEGTAAGINGTPGNIILVNATGEQRAVSGAAPLSNFTAVIDPLLQ